MYLIAGVFGWALVSLLIHGVRDINANVKPFCV